MKYDKEKIVREQCEGKDGYIIVELPDGSQEEYFIVDGVPYRPRS